MSKMKDLLLDELSFAEREKQYMDTPKEMPPSRIFNVHGVGVKPAYKNLEIESDGLWYSVIVFPDFPDYNNIDKGSTVEGWIRIKDHHYCTLVGYCKPVRNWQFGEKFL